jgi:tetratricopeptide (TPR) repeat protein
VTLEHGQPTQAVAIYCRALEIYRNAGDYRGQARCHNNIGIALTVRGECERAQRELTTAIALGRTAGTPDLWGLAALNLGVVQLRCGDHNRARELFGEAMALFAAVKNSERQLYALYNFAHLDLDRGAMESAAELYDAAASLAQRVGQSDVEIGAWAGGGLAMLALGKTDEASAACRRARERMQARADWFQGRELAEALIVRVTAADGDVAGAVRRFEAMRVLAEGSDFYSATWLTTECAEVLGDHDPAQLRASLCRYAERVGTLGYRRMRQRYEALLIWTEGLAARTE